MKKRDAIEHFGSPAAVAKALDISRAAVSLWGEFVPEGRAFQLELLTKGSLKACPEHYRKSKNGKPTEAA